MQGTFEQSSPTWLQIALGLAAAFFTGGGFYKLLTVYLSRNEREARARKIDAETRQLDVQVQQMRGDIVLEFVDRLSAQQLRMDQVLRERDEWRQRAEDEMNKNRLLEMQLDDFKRSS